MCSRNLRTGISLFHRGKEFPTTKLKKGRKVGKMKFTTMAAFAVLFEDDDDDKMSIDDRRRRDRRIPRIALISYKDSPFIYLYESGNDQALLNATATDHTVFGKLVDLFKPWYDRFMFDEETGDIRPVKLSKNGKRLGRRRDLDAIGCLGIVLHWYRTRGSCARALSMAFGTTSTPLYKWLKFGRRVLLFALQHVPQAKVTLPTGEEISDYVQAINNKYPVLTDVWAACDGLKLKIQASGNYLKQNHYYNGWTHGHYVNSVLLFAPDGKIRGCTLNCPGSWHDSTMADYGVYEKMERMYLEHGAKVVVDSAFGVGNREYLIKSAQQDPIGGPAGVAVNRAATSVRQLSEWGMRTIQAQFPRLNDALDYEEDGERKVILQLMVLLYNYQCVEIGINQILNSFMAGEDSFYGRKIERDASNVFS
jgi:hypothetical protein